MSVPRGASALADVPRQSARTTATLLASLAARLTTLHMINGASAVGSIVSGLTVLGREAAKTAEGARLRDAILAGRPGSNGELIWKELKIGEWADRSPPTPVLDQARNDLALLLAPDLMDALAGMRVAGDVGGHDAEREPAEFVDYVLGLWAFANEISSGIRLLAEPTLASERVEPGGARPEPPDGGIMR